MAHLYTPLAILEQMKDRWEHAERIVALKKEQQGLEPFTDMLTSLFPEKEEDKTFSNSLNLDEFLSWVLGSTFVKRSYDGIYSEMNQRLLTMCENMQKKGHSYKECRKRYRDTMTFSIVFRCWQQHKQAYRFDGDFAEELMQTKAVEIPIEVLKRLPFRCFYLDLELISGLNSYAGVFVYVGYDEKNGLPNVAIFPIKEPPKDSEEHRIFPGYAFGPDMVRRGIIYENEKGETCIGFINKKNNQNLFLSSEFDLPDMVLFVFQAILYLSSNKPDTMKSPKRKYIYTGKKWGRKAAVSDLSLADIGVRYGTAIRKIKKESALEEETETVIRKRSGRRKPITSHVRAAHWHHYWVGKGRAKQIVKWVPPTFVSGSGKELPVTIHNVKK